MNDDRREALRERIEAAEARQAARERAEAAGPVDQMTAFAREHPLVLVAGGLAIGIALSALVPKSPTRKLSKNAFGFFATLAELGISYGRQAMEAAEEAGHQGLARIGRLRGGVEEDSDQEIEDEALAAED
jgi:hypothetical protein